MTFYGLNIYMYNPKLHPTSKCDYMSIFSSISSFAAETFKVVCVNTPHHE